MASHKIRVLPDALAAAQAAAERIAQVAASAIELSGRFSIALSGGQTPRALYELLSDEPYLSGIDWGRVRVFFTDERCVPPGHAQSNFRMASAALLEFVEIPPENIHRMRGEIEPQAAAAEYEEVLKAAFDGSGLDLALLGMGEDGHTASLFPETAALEASGRWCVANYVPKLNDWRLTMTAEFLNRSCEAIVLVTGPAKAQAVQAVMEGPRDPNRLPIQLIDPPEGRVTWLMDAPAAGM